MDPNNMQMRMQEIQQDESFSNVLGKLLSGREGYKPVIEKRQEILRCKKCMTQPLIQEQKFCHECGTKNEIPEKK